jgi:DNA/RNA-binding domain of Phe-tRNA-synthetase-like protein
MSERRCSWVDSEAAAIGVKFRAAEIHGVQPAKKSPVLEKAKRAAVQYVHEHDVSGNEILLDYRRMFERVGSMADAASPQALLDFALKHHKLTDLNTLVDSYNMVSLQTFIVVSAHDLARVEGNPRIAMTRGTEVFHPLRAEPFTLPAGQWAGVCDNHVLCQMNCKQSELSKITLDTRDVLIYVQGNARTTDEDLDLALHRVCEEIVRFNGGEVMILPVCDGG